jgi:hypothetical protein
MSKVLMNALNECIMSSAKEALYNASVLYKFNYEESVQRCLMGAPCLGFVAQEKEVVSEKVVVQEVREVVVVASAAAMDVDVAYKKVTPKAKPKAKKVAEPTVEVAAVVAMEAPVVQAQEVAVAQAEVQEALAPAAVPELAPSAAVEEGVKEPRKRKPSPKDLREKAEREAKAAVLKAEREAKEAALQEAKRVRAEALQAAKEAKEAKEAEEKAAKAAALQAAKEAKAAKEKPAAEKPAAPKKAKKNVEAVAAAVEPVAAVAAVEAVVAEKPVAKKAEKPAAQKKTKAPEEKPVAAVVQAVVQAAPVQAKPSAAAAEECEVEDDDEEDAEIDVQPFKWNGVFYLRSADGVVYDKNTSEPLGAWNAKENKIEFDGPESEDELCATEVMTDSGDEGEGEGVNVEFGDELDGMCSAMGACAIVTENVAV